MTNPDSKDITVMTVPCARKPIRLAVVMPCYNESEALPHTVPVMLALLDRMTDEGLVTSDSFILCSNDGSRDDTWHVINKLHTVDSRVKGISLAHNRGHQNALLAGLMAVRDRCDAAVSIDADLQDDPKAIEEMVRRFVNEGDEIVYGVRSSRKTDSWFKRTTAHAFYKVQKKMGAETIYDHADYRLMSSRALDLLSQYGETNLFLRGIVPHIGLKHSSVSYERASRVAGESKYPLAKMLSFSIDGITSFSARPMRWIFFIGMAFVIVALLVAVWVLLAYFRHVTLAGWPSLMLSMWFIGGVILMSIGVVGEYIGKIFNEVKGRPRYAIAETIW